MRKTILSALVVVCIGLTSACAQLLFNEKGLSDWAFVVENNAVLFLWRKL